MQGINEEFGRLFKCRLTQRGRNAKRKMEANSRENACTVLSNRDANTMLEQRDAFRERVAGNCGACSSPPPPSPLDSPTVGCGEL